MPNRRCLCRTAAAWVLAAASATPLLAQPPASGVAANAVPPQAEPGTIVITGSRVVRDGFDAPTPTTVLSAAELQARGTAQIGEFLNEVPAFRASASPQANPSAPRNAGQYFADLRGLGNVRTLVLVNGRRFTPSSPEGQVDLNMIPSVLVERIDVVTGGASAQWGSDAVAGVVNILLDTRLGGFRSDVSFAITTYGDNEEYRASLAYGSDFAGGHGHFVVGGEYVTSAGVANHYVRPFGRDQQELVSYPGTRPAGAPSRFYASGVTPITMTRGGLIIGPNTGLGQPLRGIQFGPGGVTQPFNYGTAVGTSAIDFTGGEPGFSIRSGHPLVRPVERAIALVHADYEVSDALRLFGELNYGRSGSDSTTPYPRDPAPGGIVIQRDNPFLPASVGAIMDANNIASFSLGREYRDFGPVRSRSFNTTVRALLGGAGALGGGWTWDAYYAYGRNEFRSTLANLKVNRNLRFAADAVRDGSGATVCRDAAGCVPINLFGEGSPGAAAIDYVTATAIYDVDSTQQVAAANLQGEPVSTWAGPVSLAAGAEWRSERSVALSDPLSQADAFAYGNPKAFRGAYEVVEGYAEAVVPLARDLPFARRLDLNGAVRYADYSTSGGVWTWKLGGTWEVTDFLTLRATRSRDIRAPNNSDLYAETTAFFTLRNPLTGVSSQVSTRSGGNPQLRPEAADTLTLGLVLSPPVLPGLRLSVDYWDIRIDGAISSYDAQTVLDSCGAEIGVGRPGFFCGFVSLAGTTVTEVRTPLLNIAGFRARGVDFEASYRFDLAGGTMNARLFGTYTRNLIFDDGLGNARRYNAAGVIQSVGSIVERAGSVGGFTGGVNNGATNAPTWMLNASLSYRRDNWSAMVQGRYVGGGLIDPTLVGPDDPDYDPASPISIGDNTVPGRFYTSVAVTYRPSRQVELYGVVDNLTNAGPPFPYNALVGLYDKLGRNFRIGARLQF
ncbi:TonB-dependent receptor [Sphingosinicella sp. LHD-64]|uniref:TonB-dependent receptor domain-containing protein n=1 Tax=Sphingosinicella sp. LHD-64 TaxID=3072139 RepID=UPI00280D88DC|nr:TonB-dependent receptor [Sphingosinicella sp. LHD-64]MDQ8757439.1 TonB-dependent receptor [Sphingosinicella sp. LHD-64]